jgi:hypothetical protein
LAVRQSYAPGATMMPGWCKSCRKVVVVFMLSS